MCQSSVVMVHVDTNHAPVHYYEVVTLIHLSHAVTVPAGQYFLLQCKKIIINQMHTCS